LGRLKHVKKEAKTASFFALLWKFYGTFDFPDAVKASKMEVGEVEVSLRPRF
jgi:hypothetical protein